MHHVIPASVSAVYERPKVSLSCLQCQQRKKKCDKNNPCQACRQAGLACAAISRARLPRGRHTIQRDSADLRQRVARLEKLLSSQRNDGEPVEPTAPQDDKKTPDSAIISITEGVVGIRELLDKLAGDEPGDFLVETPDTDRIQSFDILMYGDASCLVAPYVLESPPKAIVSALLDIYLDRIDPVFKVTHTPSLHAILLEANNITPAQEALKSSVFFTAVNSLDEQECLQRFNSSKSALSGRFQLAAEVLLSRSGLLTTVDLTSLQAFVIYLAGLRACNGCRAVCTLLATAVRIGQSLGLDLETTCHTPFETELRRRTWYSIGILDLQAAFDSGSYSALAGGAFRTPPLHINDSDISPGDLRPVRVRYTFTEMTFCSATHEMLRHMRRMIHVPMDADGCPLMSQDWAQRHAIVEDCARTLDEEYLRHCNTTDTFQCFTRVVCESMIVTLRLLVRRPMYRFYNTKPPPNDDFNVLDVATDVLDRTLRKADNNDFKRWVWFAWIKWYALAVLLAELCECTEGPRVDRAWIIAEISFVKYQEMIHDSILWGSMKKLMRKAQYARNFKNGAAESGYELINHSDTPLGAERPGIANFHTDYQDIGTNAYGTLGRQENVWEDLEMQSWVTWESFVQDLSGPIQLDTTNGYQ